MFRSKLTPEEKLLRIIESSHTGNKGTGGEEDLRESPADRSPKNSKGLRKKNIYYIALVFFILAAAIFSILEISKVKRQISVQDKLIESTPLVDSNKAPEASSGISEVQKSAPAMPDAVSQEQNKDEESAAAKISQPKRDFTEGLKVVGIMWSDAPQVIIEDTKENRTFLLNSGDTIRGAQVKEILKDRVVLSYDNQEKTLM